MTALAKLLPCPFCGGEAYLSDAECGKAGMAMDQRNPRCKQCGCDLGYSRIEHAISAWNRRAALSPAELGGVETEQSIAADCYHWIAECIGTLPGYSVQEHVQTMKETLEACSDFLHDFVPSDEGGCDEAVELARNCRAVLSGRIDQYEPTPRAAEADWLPIESAPKDGSCCIVTNGVAVGEAWYSASEDGWWWANTHPTDAHDGFVYEPTNWRPLPAPPALTPPSAKGE